MSIILFHTAFSGGTRDTQCWPALRLFHTTALKTEQLPATMRSPPDPPIPPYFSSQK